MIGVILPSLHISCSSLDEYGYLDLSKQEAWDQHDRARTIRFNKMSLAGRLLEVKAGR